MKIQDWPFEENEISVSSIGQNLFKLTDSKTGNIAEALVTPDGLIVSFRSCGKKLTFSDSSIGLPLILKMIALRRELGIPPDGCI